MEQKNTKKKYSSNLDNIKKEVVNNGDVVVESEMETPAHASQKWRSLNEGWKPLIEIADTALDIVTKILALIGIVIRSLLKFILFLLLVSVLLRLWDVMVPKPNTIYIDKISLPDVLEAKGYTDEILATNLIDEIHYFQEDTLKEGMDSEKEIPMSALSPQTGEISAFGVHLPANLMILSEFIGWKIERVSGHVLEIHDGIQLTLRGPGFPSFRKKGSIEEIDSILKDAAKKLVFYLRPKMLARHYLKQDEDIKAVLILNHIIRKEVKYRDDI